MCYSSLPQFSGVSERCEKCFYSLHRMNSRGKWIKNFLHGQTESDEELWPNTSSSSMTGGENKRKFWPPF